MMRWPLTFYTERFVPDESAGCAIGPCIFIRPEKRDDIGLYHHELEHVKQAFLGLFVAHALAYRLSAAYRLKCEVAAYRAQLAHNAPPRPEAAPLYAGFITTMYGLDITVEAALALLHAD